MVSHYLSPNRVGNFSRVQSGPVVGIRLDVLHVDDPEFIEVLYTQRPKVRRER